MTKLRRSIPFRVYGVLGALILNVSTPDRAFASRCIEFTNVLQDAEVIEIGVVFSVGPTYRSPSGGYEVDFQILVEEVYRGEIRETWRVEAHVPYPLYVRPGSRLLVAGRQGDEAGHIQANYCTMREIQDEETERAKLFDLLRLVTGGDPTELSPKRGPVLDARIHGVSNEAQASLRWATVVSRDGVCVMPGERHYPGVWRLEIEESAIEPYSSDQKNRIAFAYFPPEEQWDVCLRRRCDSLIPALVRVHWDRGVSEVSLGRGCPKDAARMSPFEKD